MELTLNTQIFKNKMGVSQTKRFNTKGANK